MEFRDENAVRDCGASNMDLLPRGYFRDEKPLRQLERIGTSENAFESRKRVARKYKSSAAVPPGIRNSEESGPSKV